MLAVFGVAEATFLLVSLFVLVPFALADPKVAEDGPLPPMALLAALAVPTTLAALVALGATQLLGSGSRLGRLHRELSVRWSWRDVGFGLVLGGIGLVLTIPASALWAAWVGTDQANSAVGEAFDGQRLGPVTAVTLFLVVWLIAPMCEEILFRGALWRAFEHWRLNRWLIFVVTTLLFSVAHLELLRTPLLIVVSLPIGLARVLTGNLLSSIVAHQANNLLPAIGLLLMTLGVDPG
ncbi:MAG: CPBP family intramembrane metalloprotease [Pseudonocardiaceae bacterium]|nr:CPBP family intramembrane metalloprotease [Pseudonocardiaceae bacterium]